MPDALHAPERTAAEKPETATETVTLQVFGQQVALAAPADDFTGADTRWRCGAIYQPFLTARPLPRAGVAVDIGAAFGGFAIPFALAHPGWTVWCFEPDDRQFAALSENIAAQGLGGRVFAIRAAITGDGDDGAIPAGAETALAGAAEMTPQAAAALAAALPGLCPAARFRQHRDKPGFAEAHPGGQADPHPEMRDIDWPALPAAALRRFAPALVKLIAPGHEAGITAALRDTALTHLTGECWHPVPAIDSLRSDNTLREVHLPLAGTPLALRQTRDWAPRRAGLDVVVALYNCRDYIGECLDSLLADPCPALRVLVVDDGSTDGSGDLVARTHGDNPRLLLLRKPNGGCASARNYGRLHSDATHIAFVDADDRVDPGMFPALLDLALHSGAELVQAGFAFLEPDDTGEMVLRPGYEVGTLADLPRMQLGALPWFTAPAARLMTGQPAIWRRVHRRDFLDARDIWFPEHIRAFDDQIFQMLTLHDAGEVICTDAHVYHYRQHPGQDIRQGDERNFYSLEMFRLLLKRALAEGWNDTDPLLQSYVNTVNWIWGGLREDLRDTFAGAAAELWVWIGKALGRNAVADFPAGRFDIPDFAYREAAIRQKLAGLGDSFVFGYLDSRFMHADALRADAARAG